MTEELLHSNALMCGILGWDMYYKRYPRNHGIGGAVDSPVSVLAHKCKFHTSWDWLMKVVEKIEDIQDDHHGYFGVFISSNSCTIQGTNLHMAIDDLEGYGWVYFDSVVLNDKFESTYHAVVNWLNWNNTKDLI